MKTRWLLYTLVVCFLLVGPATAMATNDTIGPNDRATGTIDAKNTKDVYELVIPRAGKLDVALDNHDFKLQLSFGQDDEIWTLLYDVGMERMSTFVYVEPGTYMVQVIDEQKTNETLPYQLETTFTPIAHDEMEPNQTEKTAVSLPLNKWQTGFLSQQDQTDVYRIDLKKAGSLDLQAEAILDESLSFSLVDKRNQPIWEGEVYGVRSHTPIDLEPGTYYLRASKERTFFDGTGGTYVIKATFKAANNTEKESNNSIRSAAPLAFAKRQTGFLSWNDPVDYYTFTLPKKSFVTLDLVGLPKMKSDVYVLDENEDVVWSTWLTEGKSFRERVSLPIGKYYVRISPDGESLLGGTYQLQVNSTHLYPSLTIERVTSKSIEVSGRTEKGATVTMTIGNREYKQQADVNGHYAFNIAKQKVGTVIYVTSQNKHGKTNKTMKVTTT